MVRSVDGNVIPEGKLCYVIGTKDMAMVKIVAEQSTDYSRVGSIDNDALLTNDNGENSLQPKKGLKIKAIIES